MNRKLLFPDIDATLPSPGSNVPPESALEAIPSFARRSPAVPESARNHHR